MTDRFKNLAKGGWHPSGEGGGSGFHRPSVRDNFKGVNQVAGWMGKSKSSNEDPRNHQSAPLSSLKDPSSFGPPPKRLDYSASPTASTPTSTSGGSASAPVQRGTYAQPHTQQEEEEEHKPPPGPYRIDTTGLNTAHLPKPPTFRGTQSPTQSPASPSKPKPSLPPRLPPRQNTAPKEPPPSYDSSVPVPGPEQGHLNQGALNRLGQAGVSVPGLNIGRTNSPPVPPRNSQSSTPTSPGSGHGGQLSELQSRFSRMKTGSSATPEVNTGGTSFADKQAAFKTASSFRKDPSSVSGSDLRSAASTANNFRERHGEQVASGLRTANGLNDKYGVTNRLSGVESPSSGPSSPTKKKPPPPPPPKKRQPGETASPPPIPLSSKPKPT